jgi:hypothetical protein
MRNDTFAIDLDTASCYVLGRRRAIMAQKFLVSPQVKKRRKGRELKGSRKNAGDRQNAIGRTVSNQIRDEFLLSNCVL